MCRQTLAIVWSIYNICMYVHTIRASTVRCIWLFVFFLLEYIQLLSAGAVYFYFLWPMGDVVSLEAKSSKCAFLLSWVFVHDHGQTFKSSHLQKHCSFPFLCILMIPRMGASKKIVFVKDRICRTLNRIVWATIRSIQ